MNNTQYREKFVSKKFTIKLRHTFLPEDAVFILTNFNPQNRPRTQKVKEIEMALANGSWVEETAAPIKFDVNGNLQDGQHRLQACVNVNKPLTTTIALGLPPEAMLYHDGNRARTLSQRLILGNGLDSSIENFSLMARSTAIGKVWIWFLTGWTQPFRGDAAQMNNFLVSKQKFIEKVLSKTVSDGVTKRGGFRAACAAYIEKDPEKGTEFFKLATSDLAGLNTGSPILAIRHYLACDTHKGNQLQQKRDFCFTLSMIHAFHFNKTVKRITQQENWEF